MEAMQAEDALQGQDQMGEEQGHCGHVSVLQASSIACCSMVVCSLQHQHLIQHQNRHSALPGCPCRPMACLLLTSRS